MDAYQAYKEALKSGKENFTYRQERHLDPYLSDLDPFLEKSHIIKESPSVSKEIFTSMIVGTRTKTRAQSFAHNFMPLLDPSSEFGAKWISLFASQSEVGISEPILVYELYGRYFVEEGNKRVSVCKYLKTPMILAKVRHLEIEVPDSEQGRLYQQFLRFQKLSGIDSLHMSSVENYQKLELLIQKDDELSQKDKDELLSLFKSFWSAYSSLDLKRPILVGDAFLIYLESFGLPKEKSRPISQITNELETIRSSLENSESASQSLLSKTDISDKNSLLSLFTNPRVVFINASDEHNPWTADHIDAIEKVLAHYGDDIALSVYNDINTPELLEQALDEAVHSNAQLIFTTHPSMLQMSNQYAAQYPNVKILNNSLKVQSGPVRTYYAREFEALFLMGLCAGMYTQTNEILYLGDYPTNGEAAKIDAFAIGAAMVNPYVKVYLDWSTTQGSSQSSLCSKADIAYIAGQDLDFEIRDRKHFGLYDITEGHYQRLAQIRVDWAAFYQPIIASVLNHTYNSDEKKHSGGISYWWGLSNKLIDVEFWDGIARSCLHLIHYLRKQLQEHNFVIFDRKIPSFASLEANEDGKIPLDDVLTLDVLVANVVGTFPRLEEVRSEVKKVVPAQGLERLKKDEK